MQHHVGNRAMIRNYQSLAIYRNFTRDITPARPTSHTVPGPSAHLKYQSHCLCHLRSTPQTHCLANCPPCPVRRCVIHGQGAPYSAAGFCSAPFDLRPCPNRSTPGCVIILRTYSVATAIFINVLPSHSPLSPQGPLARLKWSASPWPRTPTLLRAHGPIHHCFIY